MDSNWMNDPAMKQIDPAKLELIRMAAEQTAGKSGRDLVPPTGRGSGSRPTK